MGRGGGGPDPGTTWLGHLVGTDFHLFLGPYQDSVYADPFEEDEPGYPEVDAFPFFRKRSYPRWYQGFVYKVRAKCPPDGVAHFQGSHLEKSKASLLNLDNRLLMRRLVSRCSWTRGLLCTPGLYRGPSSVLGQSVFCPFPFHSSDLAA